MLGVGPPRELKERPGVSPAGTRWLEIISKDNAALMERLRGRPGVRQATIFGTSIHAMVEADQEPADLGLAGEQVIPAEPSLEDVFVALSKAQANRRGEGP